MKTKDRFAGSLSAEYDLARVMIPHYDEHEDTLRTAIGEFTKDSRQESFTALDLGCGSGLSTKRILDADSRIRVLGIDNEVAMLNQAVKRLYQYKPQYAEFVHEDILQQLEKTQAGSVDIVASACVLHNLPPTYRHDAMREIGRVLRPRGLFVNADKYGHDDPAEYEQALAAQYENLYEFDKIGREDLRHAWRAHYAEDEKINFTEREQLELFTRFGFVSAQRIYRKRLEATYTAIKK